MNRQNEYLLTRIRSASPMELVSILYETAIQSVEEAQASLRAGDVLRRGQAVNKTVEVLFELQRSLRHDVQPEYSKNLAGLYSYMQSRVSEAHALKSSAMFDEVVRLLRTLLEGWKGAIDNLASTHTPTPEPEAEPVAAGLSPYLGDAATSPSPARSWSV